MALALDKPAVAPNKQLVYGYVGTKVEIKV
jgi:hypothetical protein